jgi:hypothetical protein
LDTLIHTNFVSAPVSPLRAIISNMHRAEMLSDLTIYAPRLEVQSLQACYDSDGVLRLLETHPDLSPKSFQ